MEQIKRMPPNQTLKNPFPQSTLMSSLIERALSVKKEIGKARIVIVSKNASVEQIRELAKAGFVEFGENRIQSALQKINALSGFNIRWHFIGHLQTNKVKEAVGNFELIHSVDSLKLLREIDKQAGKVGKVQEILLQVNISGEETKGGFAGKGGVMEAIAESAGMKNARILGLMMIAPNIEAEQARKYFAKLRQMRNEIAGELKIPLPELSMGMTNDYAVAVQEGATIVRVGRKIIEPERL